MQNDIKLTFRRNQELDKSNKSINISTIENWMKNDKLYVEDYQRQDTAWSKKQKELLIDSLYNNYDIPNILLVKHKDATVGERYEILEGQQRLTAIMDYLKDKIKYQNCFFKQLSEDDKLRFKSVNVNAVVYLSEQMDLTTKLDMYIRLNSGTRHNAWEILKANNSKVVPDVAKELRRQRLIYTDKNNIDVSIKRDNDSGWYAQLYLLEQRISNNDYENNLDTKDIIQLYTDNKDIGLNKTYTDRVKEITDMILDNIVPYMKEKKQNGTMDIKQRLNKTRIALLYAAIRMNYNHKNKVSKLSDEQKSKLMEYLFEDKGNRQMTECIRECFKNSSESLYPYAKEVASIIF